MDRTCVLLLDNFSHPHVSCCTVRSAQSACHRSPHLSRFPLEACTVGKRSIYADELPPSSCYTETPWLTLSIQVGSKLRQHDTMRLDHWVLVAREYRASSTLPFSSASYGRCTMKYLHFSRTRGAGGHEYT